MKLEALDHPKTLHFASLLDLALPTVIGHLELLWAFTAQKSPQGNVGKWPDGAIARACYWMGDPSAFVDALRTSGFIDAHPTYRLVVHDWHDHAAGWVRAKLKKGGLDFVSSSDDPKPPEPPTPVRTSEPTSDATLERTIQAKPSLAKPSQAHECARETPEPAAEERHWATDALQAEYPATTHPTDWTAALRSAAAAVSAGEVTWMELVAATQRYRAYVEAGGVSGPGYVMAPQKFLRRTERDKPAPWSQPWTPPPTKAQQQQDANIAAGQAWLAQGSAA